MKIFYQLILNTILLIGCFVGLHFALITIGAHLFPIVDNFKTLTMIYAGILDGEFTLLSLVVIGGVGALLTLGQLLIGE